MAVTERRDLRTGRTVWQARHLPRLGGTTLRNATRADVLVIGAGPGDLAPLASCRGRAARADAAPRHRRGHVAAGLAVPRRQPGNRHHKVGSRGLPQPAVPETAPRMVTRYRSRQARTAAASSPKAAAKSAGW